MNCLFAKAGDEITSDDGKVWGRFVRDVHIVNPLMAGDVERVDGTSPAPGSMLDPEVVQFFNRRRKEMHRGPFIHDRVE